MKTRALKTAIIAIEVIAIGMAITAAAVVFLFWRIGQDPVSLNLLRPSIEYAIEGRLPRGYDAKIAAIDVKRAATRGVYELRLTDVVILDAEDQAAANAPEMLLTFGLGDLISGSIGPQTVAVDGASFRIVRRENLSVDIPIVKKQSEKRKRLSLSKALNGEFLKSAFQSAVISNAELTFIDIASGRAWTAPDSEVQLHRTEDGLTASLHSKIEMNGAGGN